VKQNTPVNLKSTYNVVVVGVTSLIAALLLGTTAPVQAQQSEVEALRAQIAALTTRLDTLEADQLKTADAAKAASSTVSSKLPVTVSGLLQVHYLGFPQNNGAAQNETFRLRRGELRLTGNITPRISGTILIDPAKGLRLNTSGTTLSVNQSTNILQEIQLSYLLNQSKTSPLYGDIGQFKIPVGYEGDLVSSSALQTVERALMFRQRDVANGGYGDIRDSGAELRGSFNRFDYRLGVFNGLGERQNDLATSDTKALLARLVYKPQFAEGLHMGVSGGVGNTRNTPGGATTRADRSLLNLFAVYHKNKLTWQNEYLTADSQVLTGGTAHDIRSYYSSLGYQFTKRWEGVLRYDAFDFNRNGSNDVPKELTLGVNYYIKGNNAKIQANLVRVQGASSADVPSALQRDRTELRTNFQVAF
jgi:hypothetical protein